MPPLPNPSDRIGHVPNPDMTATLCGLPLPGLPSRNAWLTRDTFCSPTQYAQFARCAVCLASLGAYGIYVSPKPDVPFESFQDDIPPHAELNILYSALKRLDSRNLSVVRDLPTKKTLIQINKPSSCVTLNFDETGTLTDVSIQVDD